MIAVQGIVHVQDNNSPGIWFEIGFSWAKAVPPQNVLVAQLTRPSKNVDKEIFFDPNS